LLPVAVLLLVALVDNGLLVSQASNSTKITVPKKSKDLTSQDRVLIKLTQSGSPANGNVSPKNIEVKVGTTVVWQNNLPEKVYVESKPDKNHYQGQMLNASYIFPGESREEKLNEIGTFIYDGSNGFGSYYVRGTITVVNETTQEKKIPIEIPTTVPKSKKSYQLIIYLDNASTQNVIGDNFKILVYNSNNEPILSAKPNIDFNDDHQKISPPNGYPIIYQSGQYPKDIRVCAQQEYQLNGTTYLHNDCYPIIQNVQKTYWYTTFDYGEIDGFEPDSQRISQEGLKSNTQQNDFELPQILSFKRPGYDFIVPVPLIAVLDGGNVSLINDEKYPQKSTYLLTTYNPVLEFQFREGAKIPVVNIKQIVVGKIKSYNNSSDALKSSYLFENIGFNEKTVLPLQDDGFGYMVAEVQFANNISGIYALGFENTPDDSNSPDYRKSVQEFSKQNGLTIVNSSSVKIRPGDTFQLVAQSVICHLTLSYGFQVCGDDSVLQKKLTSIS